MGGYVPPVPNTYVLVAHAWEGLPSPAYVSCGPLDGGQRVVLFTPGMNVQAATIVIPNICGLPGALYTQWQPPPYFFIAMRAQNLPNAIPAPGVSSDSLRYALPASGPPGNES